MQLKDDQQLELFDESRWPRKPFCSEDLSHGLRVRPLASAIHYPYIQANPPQLRVWLIQDLDRENSAFAWEAANLPEPSWTAINKENGHAHLVWGLSKPVLVSNLSARNAPIRFLGAIDSYMREKLDADRGFAGLITKNPAHEKWHVLRGKRLCYDLHELAEHLPAIEKHRPQKRKKRASLTEYRAAGLGRNVALFDMLRDWAYVTVKDYRSKDPNTAEQWNAAVYAQAITLNIAQFGLESLPDREVFQVAKSVAKWTHQRFDIDDSDKRFSALQSYRGKKGMNSRWGNNEDKRASARLMAAAGSTQAAIALELEVTERTVRRWLNP